MKADRSQWIISASMVAVVSILTTSGANGSAPLFATISREKSNVSDSGGHVWTASTHTWMALPMEDAGVSRGFPDNKRGAEEPWHMWVSSCAGVPYTGYFLSERSFLKFDLSTIPSLENSSVRLFVYCYKTDGAPNGRVQCCSVDNDNWGEATITWNTQPAPGKVLDACTIAEAGRWYSWNVTSFVEKEYAGDKIASFCLKTPMELNEYPNNYFYGWRTKEFWEDWARPYLVVGHRVEVQISPNYREGLAGGTLSYEIYVTNTGSFSDDYSLTASDNAGWALVISGSSLRSVQPGEKRAVKLSVMIPENAEIGVEDHVIVTATSRADSGVRDDDVCLARVSRRIRPPCDDLTVVEGDPTIGNWSGFWVGRYRNNPERGWLKFDLRAIPANFDVQSARLYIYCWNVSKSANIQPHLVDDDNWRENETNCWNEPSFGAAVGDPLLVDSVGWYSCDVTSYVKSEFMGDKIVSFCLVDLGENVSPDHAAGFESKEWSNKDLWPYLEVDGNLIPHVKLQPARWPLIAGIVGLITIVGAIVAFCAKKRWRPT